MIVKYGRKHESKSAKYMFDLAQNEINFINESKFNQCNHCVGLSYEGEHIGYRFYIKGAIYDAHLNVINQLTNDSKMLYLPSITRNYVALEKFETLLISPVERFTFDTIYIPACEITTLEELQFILKSLYRNIENSTSPSYVLSSTSTYLIRNTVIENSTSLPRSKFDTHIPLNNEVSEFLLMIFNKIESHVSCGKSQSAAYELVLNEMNITNTKFNYLMNVFVKSKGRNTTVTVFTIKDYYTRRYIKVNNRIYQREHSISTR